jgi:hypothetical protein
MSSLASNSLPCSNQLVATFISLPSHSPVRLDETRIAIFIGPDGDAFSTEEAIRIS